MLRYLRIAFSATCGIICLLLIALWVRSYWWSDRIAFQASRFDLIADSVSGGTTVSLFVDLQRESGTRTVYESIKHNRSMRPPNATWKFGLQVTRNGFDASLPHWFQLALASVFMSAAWIQRFSLRTLLIAMTLVAAGLGLIVYASK